VRTILLAAVCLLAGLGLGVWWRYRPTERNAVNTSSSVARLEAQGLSSVTKALLQTLNSPVEIRFYSVLEPATVPETLTLFTARVEQLLAAYEREAKGMITVRRHQARADGITAAADGIAPFRLDPGDVAYLGLAVAQGGRKESIARLLPEWEHAVEADLSRAIARLLQPAPPASIAEAVPPAAVPTADPALTAEVKRLLPNFASISLEEGTRVLRESALQELKVAVDAMAIQLREAEQRLTRMQEAKSETEKQSALKELQRVQAEQAAKLSEIAARSSAHIEALRQLKGAYGDRLTR
jgi:ABC-type uncharacterized transport system